MSEMNASKRNKEKGMSKGICNKTARKRMKRETYSPGKKNVPRGIRCSLLVEKEIVFG